MLHFFAVRTRGTPLRCVYVKQITKIFAALRTIFAFFPLPAHFFSKVSHGIKKILIFAPINKNN